MRYFLISLGVLLLIIFGIVIFNRGGSKTVTTGRKAIKLSSYATKDNASMQYDIEGPINAIENHVSLRVTVSPNSRTVDIYRGYQGQVLATQTFPNDNNSYSAFLAALNRANFTRERRLAAGTTSDSICPTSTRTHYSIVDNDKDIMNLWSTTCASGSFGGIVSLTSTLFRAQIPNFTNYVNNAGTQDLSTGVLL